MRSTIDIDEQLLREAQKLTSIRTKKELINLSLRELIRKKKREHLASLFGSCIVDITLEDLEKFRENEF
ncbi:type II toxin-antitoxin system VapB family antitoxin [Candidatus Aerophobetes bacterium]|nr:type II toxin-antitoxin system VapB family antitoxin [Candidatus Aerophobetes bacterium]